jgi:hypothetical protein
MSIGTPGVWFGWSFDMGGASRGSTRVSGGSHAASHPTDEDGPMYIGIPTLLVILLLILILT